MRSLHKEVQGKDHRAWSCVHRCADGAQRDLEGCMEGTESCVEAWSEVQMGVRSNLQMSVQRSAQECLWRGAKGYGWGYKEIQRSAWRDTRMR